MAKLEQYQLEDFPLEPTPGANGVVIFENANGQSLFDELTIESVDDRKKAATLRGRAALSGANFVLRLSQSKDGYLTLMYPDSTASYQSASEPYPDHISDEVS